jgi:predicted TPR repeat methyltransferase
VDGNILQAIDDHEMPHLLEQFFGHMPRNGKAKITELGCGTGRNTIKLLQTPFVEHLQEVHGLDLSDEMLQLARKRYEDPAAAYQTGSDSVTPIFRVFDALTDQSPPVEAKGADGVISTLVLEHLPISIFFETIRKLLKKGGYLLLTNMHEEMGERSQAGFLDVESGKKLQGESFVYSIEEMVQEAESQGFQVDGHVKERGIDEADIELVGERGHKWLGCKVWFGCVLRYNGEWDPN